jgi:hypothetical protein
MTHSNQIWVKMQLKYYSANRNQINVSDKLSFSHTMTNMEKCLTWVVFRPPPQGGNDPRQQNMGSNEAKISFYTYKKKLM